MFFHVRTGSTVGSWRGVALVWAVVAGCGGGESKSVTAPPPMARPVSVVSSRSIGDTIEADVTPIVVEVRDRVNGSARAGAEVRFEVKGNAVNGDGTMLGRAAGGPFAELVVDTTDATGRASTRIRLGRTAGTRHIVASAPAASAADTVIVAVLPGAAVGIRSTPLDTVVFLGAKYRQAASAFDRGGNPIAAAATFGTGSPSVCSVSADGVVTGVAFGYCAIGVSIGVHRDTVRPRVIPSATILVRRGTSVGTLSLDGTGFSRIADVDSMSASDFQWLTPGLGIVYWEAVSGNASRAILLGLDGSTRTLVSLPFATASRRFNADGSWLAATVVDPTNYSVPATVVRLRSDGSGLQTVISRCCSAFGARADISIDGTRVAFGDASSGYYVNYAAGRSSLIGASSALRFSPDGARLARVIPQGALTAQDVGALAGPEQTIDGGPGYGHSFDRIANWSPDAGWILAGGRTSWWIVPTTGGPALLLPRGIGTTYVVLDGWKP